MDNYKRLKPFESGLFTNLINQKYKLVPKPPLELQVVEAKAKGLTLVSRTDHRCYGFYKIDECGHDLFLHYGAVRKMHMGSKPKCHTCTLKKHVESANKKSLTFIKYTTSNKSEAMYVHQKCGHSSMLKIGNVALSSEESYTCTTCFEERISKEAIETGIELLGAGSTLAQRLYKLPCGHTKSIPHASIPEGAFRCRVCQEDQYEREAELAGIVYHRGVKASHYDKRVYTLKCGCVKELGIGCVKRNAFECKNHSERFIDFTVPITVYIIKVIAESDTYLKLGFAMDVKGRIVRYGLKNSTANIIHCLSFENGEHAVAFEKLLHAKYKDKRIDPEHMRNHMYNGFTECYPTEMLNVFIDEFYLKEKEFNLETG